MAYRVPNLQMDLQELLDLADNEEEHLTHIPRRYMRDADNPLEKFTDREFRIHFRFGKDTVLHGLLPKVQDILEKRNSRGLFISPLWQVLMCLRFYATGSFHSVHAELAGINQRTVSRVIRMVSLLFARLLGETIRMPEGAEARTRNRRLFKELGHGKGNIGLPGIDGVIDCTHVRLVANSSNNLDETYRNRKGYFSLNVQAVVGPHTEFLDLVPEWAGSMHDNRIFRNSLLYMRYMERELDGMLVGDAGYPALPFLLTPILHPLTEEHISYNEIHARTRTVVEKTFEIWKKRFPCLERGLGTTLQSATTIIVACAVLHNLSLTYNDVLEEDEPQEDDEAVALGPEQWQAEQATGFAVRDAVIGRLFQ